MHAPETLDAQEVALLLRADAETIMVLARRGDLPGTRIGRGWVFLRDDVLAYLRARITADTAQRKNSECRNPPAPTAVALIRRPSRKRTAPVPLPALPSANKVRSP
jgi:excisionase family DNA binding protein